MKHLLNVYKPQGLTPLETINLVKQKFLEYKNEKIGYAGRLDPLAHGVLLLMVGEETTKEKDKYLNLSKEYEFEAVFGVSTDTYDALGLIQNIPVIASATKQSQHKEIALSSSTPRNDEFKNIIQSFIKSKLGKHTQPYPPFSSKTVEGKPLFWWAKENKLSEINIPEREIEIFDFQLLKMNKINANELQTEIIKQIDSVKGDFRQEEIKKTWEKFFRHPELASGSHGIPDQIRNDKINEFKTARFKISCSSGTYIRSLTNELGEILGTGAITLEILRTKVGEHSLKNSLQF